MQTRRDTLSFLTLAASLPALLTLPAHAAETRIDCHHHFFPPEYLARVGERVLAAQSPAVARAVLDWTPQRSIERMDAAGIGTAILSLSTPGVWWNDVAAGRALSRLSNDYAAQLARDHRGRFGHFAAVPLPDREGSLAEIAYALDVLKADGVGALSSYDDVWLGDPVFDPVLSELNRRKAVVFVHPTAPKCCSSLMAGVPPAAMEFLTDTARTITSLLVNGKFAQFPDIRFIFPHAGGTITVLAARYDGPALGARRREIAPDGVKAILGRLHFDVANSVNPSTMAALLNLVPASQVLFGSDYPFIPVEETAAALDAYPLARADLDRINRGNAGPLFPRFSI